MYIDVTDFVTTEDPADFSASRAELGDDAGKITWNAAMDRAAQPRVMLDTPEKLDALRDHMRGFGAWEDEEIDAWTPDECNALLIQMISGDMREGGLPTDPTDDDWTEYERRAEEGTASGSLGRGGDGRIYYYLGG